MFYAIVTHADKIGKAAGETAEHTFDQAAKKAGYDPSWEVTFRPADGAVFVNGKPCGAVFSQPYGYAGFFID